MKTEFRLATKVVLLLAVVFIAYGYLARVLNIYFFWDSRSIGFILLSIASLLIANDFRKKKTLRNQKGIKELFFIGLLVLIFLLLGVSVLMIKESEPYEVAREFIESDSTLKSDIGKVRGFGIFPFGKITTYEYNFLESGQATFYMTIFGSKKFKDVSVHLEKEDTTFWKVTHME